MDKWRSGVFSMQTWCIPLEAFGSKKEIIFQVNPLNFHLAYQLALNFIKMNVYCFQIEGPIFTGPTSPIKSTR